MTDVPSSDSSESGLPGVASPAGPVLVDVNISDDRWLERLPGLATLAGETARDAFFAGSGSVNLMDHGNAAVEISLTFADDEFIQDLNARHREIDKSTNVLSFPAVPAESVKDAIEQLLDNNEAGPPELLLGDVVLAIETIVGEAEDQQKRIADHVAHLVAHGVLHLLGYDHEQSDEAARMEGLEIGIMENLGIGNPYDTVNDRASATQPGEAS